MKTTENYSYRRLLIIGHISSKHRLHIIFSIYVLSAVRSHSHSTYFILQEAVTLRQKCHESRTIVILNPWTYSHLYWKWDTYVELGHSNLCHFSTEMAGIWSPGTSFQDVWTFKISALYLLYFPSYESFCGVFSDFQ